MTDEDRLADAYDAALAAEKAGRRDEAAALWREVLALDPADPGGAAVRLAALGADAAPGKAAPAYVATLFDQHAEVFDGILCDQLGYDAPWRARAMTDALSLGPFAAMLDLGCGTGLAGEAYEDAVEAITGVDLSPGMIEMADEKELYGDLYVADAVSFLEGGAPGETWDLVAALDVLPYLGDLAPLFAGLAARLRPGGTAVFSTETESAAALAGRDWMVTPGCRFAHDGAYIRRALAHAGLIFADETPIVVRSEKGAPIHGGLFVARAPD